VLRQELQPDVRVIVIEPGAVATELPEHITHAETRPQIEQFYQELAIPAEEIAEIISPSASADRGPCRSTRSWSGPPRKRSKPRSTAGVRGGGGVRPAANPRTARNRTTPNGAITR